MEPLDLGDIPEIDLPLGTRQVIGPAAVVHWEQNHQTAINMLRRADVGFMILTLRDVDNEVESMFLSSNNPEKFGFEKDCEIPHPIIRMCFMMADCIKEAINDIKETL